ncbi:hypothetical protein THRCLA_21071, partial [Thraustotheca clavata]
MTSGRVKEIDDLFEQQETDRMDLWESTATDDQVTKDFIAAAPSGQGQLSWGDDLVAFMSTGSSSQAIPAPVKANESMWDDFLGLSQVSMPSSAPITHEINFNDDLREFFVHSPVAQKAAAYDFISLESPMNAIKNDEISAQDQRETQTIEQNDAVVTNFNHEIGIFNTLQEAKPSEVNPLDAIVFNANPMLTTDTKDEILSFTQEHTLDHEQGVSKGESDHVESVDSTQLEHVIIAQDNPAKELALTKECFSIDDDSQGDTPQAAEDSYQDNFDEAVKEAHVALTEETHVALAEETYAALARETQVPLAQDTQVPLDEETHAAHTEDTNVALCEENYETMAEETHEASAAMLSNCSVAFTPSEIASNMATEDSHSVYQDLLSPTSTDILRDNALETYDNLSLSDDNETRHEGIITLDDDDDETTATESFPTETVDSSSSASSPAGTSFFSFINTAQEGSSLDGDVSYDPMVTPTGANSYEDNSLHPQEEQSHQYEEECYFSSPAALESTKHRASDAGSSNSSENLSAYDVNYGEAHEQPTIATSSESIPHSSITSFGIERTEDVLATSTEPTSFSIDDDDEEENHELSVESHTILTTEVHHEPTVSDTEHITSGLQDSEHTNYAEVFTSDTAFGDSNTQSVSEFKSTFVAIDEDENDHIESSHEHTSAATTFDNPNTKFPQNTPVFSVEVDASDNDHIELNHEQNVVTSHDIDIQPNATQDSFNIEPPSPAPNPWLEEKHDEFELNIEQNHPTTIEIDTQLNSHCESIVVQDQSF